MNHFINIIKDLNKKDDEKLKFHIFYGLAIKTEILFFSFLI